MENVKEVLIAKELRNFCKYNILFHDSWNVLGNSIGVR